MIEKKLFCEVLESIMLQMLQDKEIGSYFIVNSSMNGVGENVTIVYNTNRVVLSCVKLLQQYFPKDENGFCEIEHFIFNLEFGKPLKEGLDIESFEQFYSRLIKNL